MENQQGSIYCLLKKVLTELNTQVVEHGERVAFLELMMAKGRNLPDDIHMEKMMLACFAHDIGAYKTDKFLNLLRFDAENTLEHCIYSYLFMKYFSPLGEYSETLLYHHTFYREKEHIPSPYFDDGVLIHMLDRVDVLNISCSNKEEILMHLTNNRETIFNPKDVDDFIRFDREFGIIDKLNDGSYSRYVKEYFDHCDRSERLMEPIINMLTFEVDFKSEQTVIHSVTTAMFSKCLAEIFGLSERETDDLFLASRLHDLGKIKIPTEILEKPGKLTPEEYDVIKTHSLYTYKIIEGLFPENIIEIAYRHHERMDGSGYPSGLDENELSLQDKILQVADVASALVYRRSYKDAMEKEKVVSILKEEKARGKLDAAVVDTFCGNYDDILAYTTENSKETIRNYENLQTEYHDYLHKYSNLNHENDSIGSFTIGGDKATLQ